MKNNLQTLHLMIGQKWNSSCTEGSLRIMIQPAEKHRALPEKLMTCNKHRKLFECFVSESKWMELLTSLKLILSLRNIRLCYQNRDPPLLLCKSAFPLVNLMNLDTICALTERLIFKGNMEFQGLQKQLITAILRFLLNCLGFVFTYLTLFAFNPLYPLLLYNRGVGTWNEVCLLCGRGLLSYNILNSLILFPSHVICNFFFFSSFTIMQLLKDAESIIAQTAQECGEWVQAWFCRSGKHQAQDHTAWMHVLISTTTCIQAAFWEDVPRHLSSSVLQALNL